MRVMGIDCSTKKLACVTIESGCILNTDEMNSDAADMNERIVELYAAFQSYIKGIDKKLRPDCIYVEQAIYVRNIKVTLGIDAVVNAVRFISYDFGIPCFIIDNRYWKKNVLGNGTAGKEDIMKFVLLKYKDDKDLFTSQDLADAACIALCGHGKVA